MRTLFLALLLVCAAVIVFPDLRTSLAWVLAFLSLLMGADLVRSAVRKRRGSQGGR